MHRKAGFTIIELLIVVTVIMTLAALALPNFSRSRIQASETSTVASLRSITTAQIGYFTTYQGYPANLSQLGPPPTGTPASSVAADLIDQTLASGARSGYTYVYLAADVDGDGRNEQFTVRANPTQPGITGNKHYYVDHTNVIRFNLNAPAGPGDTPIPN